MYHYTDPARAGDAWALPDVETYHAEFGEMLDDDGAPLPDGWYFAFGFPGCLHDSEPWGPYATEEEALSAARRVADIPEVIAA